jgi:hypothetical protein
LFVKLYEVSSNAIYQIPSDLLAYNAHEIWRVPILASFDRRAVDLSRIFINGLETPR